MHDAAVNESVTRARLFPPAENLYMRWSGHDPESVAGHAGSPVFPHFLVPGSMTLKGPKSYNHEWLHFFRETSRNHYSLSDAFTSYADQWGTWDIGEVYRKPVVRGNELHYVQVPRARPFAAPERRTFSLSEIEARFRQENAEGHNALGTPAMKLGDLAKLEEARLKLPAYGFFLMREVATGMPVRKALAYCAKSLTIRRERLALLKAHPELDWLH